MEEEDVSSDDNDMIEVKVLMSLANDKNVGAGKKSARNGEWVKITMKKVHTLLDMEANDKRKYFINYWYIDLNAHIPSQKKIMYGLDQLPKDPSSYGKTDLVFVKSLAKDIKVSTLGVKRPWLSESKGFTLPNHDTSRILLAKSQINVIDPSFAITDSSASEYDSTDESLVCSTLLPLLEKLDGVEPVSGPKTIKSILKSKSILKAKTLKGATINDHPQLLLRMPIWYMDSGCSRHMTSVKSYMHKYMEQTGPKVVFGDDSTCITEGYGSNKCNGAGMITRAMAKEHSATLARECLFVDFLSGKEPKNVFEALKHPGWVDAMQEELN
nr:retrovirus-related Pol polyprotein from transposon TNT 1-94 [Tanacetum cinerariifolium]